MTKEGKTSAERVKKTLEMLNIVYDRAGRAAQTKGQKRLKDFEK